MVKVASHTTVYADIQSLLSVGHTFKKGPQVLFPSGCVTNIRNTDRSWRAEAVEGTWRVAADNVLQVRLKGRLTH